MSRIAALSAALLMASACGGVVPTAPSASSPGTGLALTCSAPSLLAGDLVVCMATAASVNVSTDAVWTSSDPNIATSQGIGLFVGKSDGPGDTDCDIFRQQRVRTVDGASARRASRDGGGVSRQLQSWHHRHSVVARLLRRRVCGLRHADARRHGSIRCDRQHKRTADSSARWRRYLISTTFTLSARHHACLSDGSPSGRFDDVDGGSGRLARAVLCGDAVTDGSDAAANSELPGSGSFAPRERLTSLRKIFFADPHQSLCGRRVPLRTQAGDRKCAKLEPA